VSSVSSEYVVFILSLLVILTAIINLIGVLGFYRFKNFYLRLHAATVSTIGGAFYPLLVLSIIGFIEKEHYIGVSLLLSAFLILLLSPTGTHALARATYRKRIAIPEPLIGDKIKEEASS
jgi:multicomponent Na+:H+ antiporter subunit G